MKKTLAPLILAVAMCLTGCGSLTNSQIPAEKIQNALTNLLPPDFKGDFEFRHGNPYFQIGLKVRGLHKTPDGKWSWTALEYDRNDFFNTSGRFVLTPSE